MSPSGIYLYDLFRLHYVFHEHFSIFSSIFIVEVSCSGFKTYHMGRVMRKLAFCICEKDADQLRGNSEADQRFFFLVHR